MRTRLLNCLHFYVAATHFHALTDTQKDSYDHLIENLKAALCPAVCKEMLNADFTARLLHDKEDPAVYLHSLRELLDKADPTLRSAAKEALLGRQFFTGLPATMKLKLLEHNPTPTLTEMVSICKQLLAIRLVAGDAPPLHSVLPLHQLNLYLTLPRNFQLFKN